MTAWSEVMPHTTDTESRAAKAYRVVVSFCSRLVMGNRPERRATDRPGEDHYQDRETDWRKAPRPVLIVAIYALMGALSFSGSVAYWAISDRIQKIEAAQRDTRWDMLATVSERQATQEARLRQYDEAQQEMQQQLREIKRLLQKGRDR